jgi:hypothetical protein
MPLSLLPPGQGGDIAEMIGSISPGVGSLSREAGSLEIEYETTWDKYFDFAFGMLGTAEVSGNRLRRGLPTRHPIYENFWAQSITAFRGVQFDVSEVSPGVPVNPVEPLYDRQPWYARYNHLRGTVVFAPVPYLVKADEDTDEDKEWERYTSRRFLPGVDVLSIANADYRFDAALPAAPKSRPAFQGASQIIPKATLEVTWYHVPEKFYTNGVGFPTWLSGLQGAVNSTTFMGRYPPGTVLYESYDETLVPDPIPPFTDLDNVERVATLRLVFKYFDPPRGTGVTGATAADRGHNLSPWVSGAGLGSDTATGDGLFYPASLQGNGVVRIYRADDLNKIFTKA